VWRSVLAAVDKGWLTVVRSKLEVAASNDADLTEIMLEPDRGGRTPLHVACINGHLKVVDELLSEWAGSLDIKRLVCAEDNAGRTPLHLAASGSKVKCAKFIIATGHAPLKVAAFDGRTALHTAAVASCQPMAQLLFENCPWLLKQEDVAGCTALDIAQEIDPASSVCSFLEHCYKYGATWKVIEWVDPVPLDGILDVDPGPIGETGWTLFYTEENDQYFYHEETKTTTWDEPEEVTKVFEEMEKQQKLDRVWEKVDTDGNGWLDRDELKAVLLLLGKSEDEIDIAATMAELDEDGNEEVCKEEFAPWYFALGDDALGALAKAEKQEKKKAKGEDAAPWKCDVCTTMNRPRANNCQLCGRDKGASLAQPEPEIEKPKPRLSKGILNIRVIEAFDLKSMDFFGKNDPYCTIKVGGVTKRCTTIEGGGADPAWGFGEGELLTFEFRRKPHQMEAKAWDEDEHDDDDCIGTGWVELDEQEELEPWSMDRTFPIRDQKGEITGRLHFTLDWKPEVKVHDDNLLEEVLAGSETGQKVLKQQQERKLKQMWKQIDEDGSGELDASELKSVMLLMGRDEKSLDMKRVMAAIDRDRSGSVSFAEFEQWWDKQDKEMQEQLQINAAAEPEPEPEPEPELEHGTLTLNVMEARKLKKMDRVGDNDPYVTIKVPQWNKTREVWNDGVERRTTTIEGGGATCAWGFGKGEPLVFEDMLKIPPRIDVSAFDEDTADADDHIGTGFIKLGEKDELVPWEADEWITILEKAGRKTTGEVRVVSSWNPLVREPEKPLLGKMTVKVYEATDLKSVDTFGKNDVYACITTGGLEKKTRVLGGAGSTAKWGAEGEQLVFDVSLFRDAFPPKQLDVSLFDENTGEKDLLIGSYILELEHKSNDTSLNIEKNWYDISDTRGKPAGLVQLAVGWVPDPDNEKMPEEKEPIELTDGSLKVTVLEAAELKQMDRLGLNDVYTRVTVSGKEKRTRTCTAEEYADRGEPEWNNGKGDTLSYRVRRLLLPTTIQLIAMDEDKDADDHIGTGFVTLDEEMQPQLLEDGWMLDQWVSIKSNKGKSTGRVRVQISWKPKIYSRKELAKRAAEEEQSKLEQVWKTVDVNFDGFLDAVELQQVLELMGMAKAHIDMISIMAEIDADGSGEVDWDEFQAWWERQEKAQREEAVLAAKAAVLRPAQITARVISARKLKRMDIKGNDVYCVVTPKSATVETEQEKPWRTTTIYSAQHTGTPVWPKGEECTWDFEKNEEMPERVMLSAWDEDQHDSDDKIGEMAVELAEFDREAEWQTEDWYPLCSASSKRKKVLGEVQLRLSWLPRQKSKEELRIEREREFFAAVAADDPHALRLLLARGVDPNCRNSMGMTAIELATERRKRKALSYLQKQITAPQAPEKEPTAAAGTAGSGQVPASLPPI
jgi:Ca2+-binding EF-hand superfamily protein